MRILFPFLVLVAGLNLIVARSFWDPNNDYNDFELSRKSILFDDIITNDSSEEKYRDEADLLTFAEHNDDLFGTIMDGFFTDLIKFDGEESEEIGNLPKQSVKEDKGQSEEYGSSLLFLISSRDNDNEKSDEVKSDSGIEISDLIKSSEEKKVDEESSINITDKEIKELTEFLILMSAVDELLKVSIEDLNKTEDKSEYDSKENDLKDFDNFLKSLIDVLEENDGGEDNNEDDTIVTTTKKDSSEENYDFTAPKDDISEEVNVKTTTEKDSSEEDDFTTPKPNSDENDNSKEFNIIDFMELSHTNDVDQEENSLKHKYEIIDATSSPYAASADDEPLNSNMNDNDIVHQYVQLREVLDTDQKEMSVNKLNLDRDFYNVISGDNNGEGLKKIEKDVVVLQENVERIKRHINGMENINSKLYFKNLFKDALKKMQAKTNVSIKSFEI